MITHAGTEKIETERLILRKFKYTDDENMLKYWISDPEIQSLYSEPVYNTKQEVKELLHKYIASYEKDDYYRWAIILKKTDECIGQIAYFLVDNNNHFAEIEYCIGRLFQRKGLATEAAKALIQYGFDKINLHKVQICHKSINIQSRRVIEKCGLVYEGTLRHFFYEDGKYIDRLYYSILKDEYMSKIMTKTINDMTEINYGYYRSIKIGDYCSVGVINNQYVFEIITGAFSVPEYYPISKEEFETFEEWKTDMDKIVKDIKNRKNLAVNNKTKVHTDTIVNAANYD